MKLVECVAFDGQRYEARMERVTLNGQRYEVEVEDGKDVHVLVYEWVDEEREYTGGSFAYPTASEEHTEEELRGYGLRAVMSVQEDMDDDFAFFHVFGCDGEPADLQTDAMAYHGTGTEASMLRYLDTLADMIAAARRRVPIHCAAEKPRNHVHTNPYKSVTESIQALGTTSDDGK
jgi:hypothetical protein